MLIQYINYYYRYLGTFLRVTDAVKGPFFPPTLPVPMPTYFASADGSTPLTDEIWAPVSEKDKHDYKDFEGELA